MSANIVCKQTGRAARRLTGSRLPAVGLPRDTPPIRNVQQLGRRALGFLESLVIARRRLHVRVPGHPLHGGDVGAGVQQVVYEGAPEGAAIQMERNML
jgi:hypothetical protein